MFWDVVYVPKYETTEVGDKVSEIRRHFIGFAWNVGHAMTFKILTDDTQEIIARSRVCLALVGENNLRQDIRSGAIPERVYIRSPNLAKVDDPDFRLPSLDLRKCPFTVGGKPAYIPSQLTVAPLPLDTPIGSTSRSR